MTKHSIRYPIAVVATIATFTSFSGVQAFAVTATGTGYSMNGTSTSVSSTSSTTSQVAISQKQAESIAKKLLPIPSGYTLNPPVLQQNWAGYSRSVYSLQWQGPQQVPPSGRLGVPPAFANAIIDANTGAVLSFNNSGQRSDWFETPTVSLNQAKQQALTWMNKLVPSVDSSSLTLQQSGMSPYGAGGYSFRFVDMVNGIPAPFNSATIMIGPNGSLTNYTFSWHNVTFPSAKASVSLTNAQQTYRKALGLHLAYIPPLNGGNAQSTILAYIPNGAGAYGFFNTTSGSPWVDANTGQALNADGTPVRTSNTAYSPLVSGGPTQFPTPLSTALDQAQAEALAQKIVGSNSKLKLLGANTSGYSGPSGSGTDWDVNFINTSTQEQYQVTIDAQTGLLSSYMSYINQPMPPSSPAPSDMTQAIQNAESFMKRAFPTLTGAIALDTAASPLVKGSNTVNFVVLHDGIPVQNDISVNFNAAGSVQRVFFNPLLQMTYPKTGHVISTTQAEDAYLKAAPLHLAYELPVTQTLGSSGVQMKYSSTAKLVYAPQWPNGLENLDANTGAWVSATPQGGQVPTDVKGHVGAQSMTILAEHGTLPLTNGQVHPDATVTRAEFVSWLVQSSGVTIGGSGQSQPFADVPANAKYAGSIDQAVAQGWLTPGGDFHPQQPLTRVDAAQIMINWLGWNTMATKPSIFSDPFIDSSSVPSAQLGDAILANDFGIIPAQGGKFLPNNKMTVADAAIAIVHAYRVQSGVN